MDKKSFETFVEIVTKVKYNINLDVLTKYYGDKMGHHLNTKLRKECGGDIIALYLSMDYKNRDIF